MSVIEPTNSTGLIIDDFINYATAHLSTISGVINTISLYPPLQTPGPAVILWAGYTVAPAKPSFAIPTAELATVFEANETLDAIGLPIENGQLFEVTNNEELIEAAWLPDANIPDDDIRIQADYTILQGESEKEYTLPIETDTNKVDKNSEAYKKALEKLKQNKSNGKVDFNKVTTRVIRELEGGYYHPDMLADGRIKDSRYGASGETMYGIDRKAGAPASVTGASAEAFWNKIDDSNARTEWKWGSVPKEPLRSELVTLAADIMKKQYEQNLKYYVKDLALIDVINSNENLLFNFSYASWNGPGWFNGFAKVIKKAYNEGTQDPEKLAKIFVQRRVDNTGIIGNKKNNSLIAQGGGKISKILGIPA
jgi:hypothetical protein